MLLCATQELTAAASHRLDTVLGELVRWDDLLYDARWHKLSGFLYEHLHTAPFADRVPQEFLQALKGDYLRYTAKFLYYRTELVAILGKLREASIPVIVLKGSALVGSVYDGATGTPVHPAPLPFLSPPLWRPIFPAI